MGLCNSLHTVTSGALAIINPRTFSRFLFLRGLYMCNYCTYLNTHLDMQARIQMANFNKQDQKRWWTCHMGKGSKDNAQIIREAMFPQPNVPLWSQFRLRKTKQQKREEMWTVKMSKWKKEEDNTERENNTLDTLGKLGKGRNMWTIQSKIRGKTQGNVRGEKGTEMTPKQNSRIGKQHQQKIH